MYSQKIVSYLIYGAYRNPLYTFPNPDLGYGEFNLLGTFNILARIYNTSTRNLLRDNNESHENDVFSVFKKRGDIND